MFGGMVEMGTG